MTITEPSEMLPRPIKPFEIQTFGNSPTNTKYYGEDVALKTPGYPAGNKTEYLMPNSRTTKIETNYKSPRGSYQ